MARLNLLTPEGSLIPADTYNRLFTMHGVIMVFFFLVPVVPAALGNFILPLMIGAKDLCAAADQFIELVFVRDWGGVDVVFDDCRRRGYGLDVLHAVQFAIVAL